MGSEGFRWFAILEGGSGVGFEIKVEDWDRRTWRLDDAGLESFIEVFEVEVVTVGLCLPFPLIISIPRRT